MPRNRDVKDCWYEAQHRIDGDAEWVMWEVFPYDHEAPESKIRLQTRHRAIRAARLLNQRDGAKVRVVHVEQVFLL